MKRRTNWRRCGECHRRARHYVVEPDGASTPLCESHAAEREALGHLLHAYPPVSGPRARKRLRRYFYKATEKAELLGYPELADAIRTVVRVGLIPADPEEDGSPPPAKGESASPPQERAAATVAGAFMAAQSAARRAARRSR
jgi:hypothetical protein